MSQLPGDSPPSPFSWKQDEFSAAPSGAAAGSEPLTNHPFEAEGEGGEPGWVLPQPFPTSLVGLWPGNEPPKAEQVTKAFSQFVGAAVMVLEEIEPEDDAIVWNRVLEVPGLASPVIVWAEPARAMGPDDLPDLSLARHRWVVGCEAMLAEQTPLGDFIALMRLLAGSLPAIPAVLDATTRQWFMRDGLQPLSLDDEPTASEEVLWRIHAAGRAERLEDDDRVWLYTIGLWRCGRPELEILELPGRHVGTAITLLNGIAALALASSLPRSGVVASVGENLKVQFRPWQEVAEYLDPESVGSPADRRLGEEAGALNPLTGVRAAVCDPEPRGAFRRIWTWPESAIRLLEDGRGAIYLSERSTRESARRAKATWPEFATAFAAVGKALQAAMGRGAPTTQPAFLIKAAFSDRKNPERGREHLWFEIKGLRGDAVEAELLNTPQLATHLRPGQIVAITRDAVTDWRVMLPGQGFGPGSAHELLAAVDRFRQDLDSA